MEVVGEYHALWILLPVSISQLENMIDVVGIQNKQEEIFEKVFLFWELGRENNCGPSWGSIFRNSFFEAKCSIPGLLYQPLGNEKLITLKSAIIMDNYINMQASRYLHCLDTYYTKKIKFSASEYEITLNNKKIQVEFEVCTKSCCNY